TAEHKAWIGREEAPVHVEVSRRDIIKYAIATEQTQPKYLAGDEAPPMFIFNLFGPLRQVGDMRHDGLPRGTGSGPKLPLQRVMAGGTELILSRPIRPGDRLTGVQRIVDMYEKEGSQGPLIFTVRSLKVTDAEGLPVLEEIQTAIAR
ncbi:MAG: MaoC family dehydratase, partial [Gammaproteobacteria bacterium]|nr:MaoC family dehydratase [Gammaproteobacteria bacterium]